MAVTFTCECGKKFSVNDKLAGKRGKCKACGQTLIIPRTSEDPNADDLVSVKVVDEQEVVGNIRVRL